MEEDYLPAGSLLVWQRKRPRGLWAFPGSVDAAWSDRNAPSTIPPALAPPGLDGLDFIGLSPDVPLISSQGDAVVGPYSGFGGLRVVPSYDEAAQESPFFEPEQQSGRRGRDASASPPGRAQSPEVEASVTSLRPSLSSGNEETDASTSLINYDGGPHREQVALAQGRSESVKDPALAGVNREVRRRIGANQSVGAIWAYLEAVQKGLGREMLGQLQRTVEFRRTHRAVPMNNYYIDLETIEVPMSNFQAIRNDVAQSPVGAYFMGAGDVVSAGTLDTWTDDPERTRAAMAQIASENPISSAAGSVAGGLMMSELAGAGAAASGLGRAAPVVGDTLYGAAYGAGSQDENRFEGALLGGLTAGAGGELARGVVRGGGNAIDDELFTRRVVQQPGQVEKFVRQGFTPAQAQYLAEPYEGMGHHFIPRKRKSGIVNRQVKLPQLISESRFNVLKPPGMSRGDFYELHYKVDRSFNSARLPRKVGTRSWRGKPIGLERHGQAGRWWYGSPRELKAAAAAPFGAGAAYWYLGEEDE